jgi:hypothetical protein
VPASAARRRAVRDWSENDAMANVRIPCRSVEPAIESPL